MKHPADTRDHAGADQCGDAESGREGCHEPTAFDVRAFERPADHATRIRRDAPHVGVERIGAAARDDERQPCEDEHDV